MSDYLMIALVALCAALSPGPDFIVVSKQAISHGRNHGIAAAIGITSGLLIHSTYCLLGLAIVITHSLVLFNLIKYLGAAYLIYLGGISLINRQKRLCLKSIASSNPSFFTSYFRGLLTNALNPKCTLFMLSVFTVLVQPHTPKLILSIYALEIIAIATVWFIGLSFVLTQPVMKKKIEKIQHVAEKIMGGVLIMLGAFVFLESS